MTVDPDRQRLFGRRAAILAGGQLVLASALVGRMYQLQVIEADKYRTLADDNRISLRLLAPPRGRILDRHGAVLAANQQNFRVLMVAERADDLSVTLAALARIIPLAEDERRRILREAARRRRFVPVLVQENVPWQDVARIEVNAPDLPGLEIDVGSRRAYPLGTIAANVVGYVGAVSEVDAADEPDPLLALPDFRVGRSGIERSYDGVLRGAAGTSRIEVNAVGRTIRELTREEPKPGQDLRLSLDAALQVYVTRRLGDESATATVMDAHTGEVLVMASTPGYDPNLFAQGIHASDWKALISDERAPLTNKAIAGQFAPGSTFKMVTALAALQAGTADPEQKVFCPGYYEIGNARFHCWKRSGHGSLDLIGALKHSCDVYFYEIARRTGIDPIAEVAGRLGLGHATGIDLPGEHHGTVPSRVWKRATIGASWYPGETLVNGIGQGYVTATALQLATMTARLANGGLAVSPRLVAGPPQRPAPLGLDPDHLAVIRRGMTAVTNEPGGTAFSARIDDPAMAMDGKTGTAQVRRITLRERRSGVIKNEDLPWKRRDHALFVGYAPPRRAALRLRGHRRARRGRLGGRGADRPRHPDRGAEGASAPVHAPIHHRRELTCRFPR